MTYVARFNSTKFDVAKERPNPINPIPGESLLLWLREKARTDLDISEPATEDWGWYSDVVWKGRTYMLGSCASKGERGEWEWLLQIEKQRSLSERLLGRAKMESGDECAMYFQRLLEGEASFKDISVDPEL